MGFCGLKPLLFRRKANTVLEGLKVIKAIGSPKKSSKVKSKENGESMELSFVGADQLILMVEIHKKIMAFRDIMDLAPCNSSASLREIVMKTLQDLQKLYPKIITKTQVSKIKDKDKPIDQVMAYFCESLKSLGESWIMENDCMEKLNIDFPICKDKSNMRQLGETMLITLDNLMKLASERFDIEEDQKKELSPSSSSFGKYIRTSSFSDSSYSCGSSPITPRSVLPELTKYSSKPVESLGSSCGSPLLWSLRVQSVGKLNPVDVKRFSFHMSPAHIEKIDEEEEEPITKIDVDDDKALKETSEDLVFDLDTNEDDHNKISVKNDQAMDEDVKLPLSPKQLQPQSLKPIQTPSLLQQEPMDVSLPSLPPPPPPPPQFTMLQPKNVPQPPPPPPPPVLKPNVVEPPPSAPTPPPSPPSVVKIPPPPPPPTIGGATTAPPPPPPPQTTGGVVAAPPPPPPPMKGGSVPAPPPPVPRGNGGGAPPPPPPGGAGRILRPKATTKLKRSTQLGNLYRTLKGKVEGPSLKGKSAASGRKGAIGGASTGGKQGMADALAEMTKRSSYFIQIEEDVQKYTKQIIELRSKITNFKTNDMTELSKFHRDVESILENLTDESQVLSRFEGFPTKKLEAIRMAAALYNKLDSILTELQNWKIINPLSQLLDKVERYFNKIKTELDALERTKDDEAKKLKGQNIEFDFHILIKIKEAVVDVSSSCMELALKEKREENSKVGGKMLWRAFQFAFRVYTFAGGHDDRADNLTRELAKEIESEPNQ